MPTEKSLNTAQDAESRSNKPGPQDALHDLKNIKVVRPKQLLEDLKISRATLYRRIADGHIPKPLRIGSRITGWRVETIANWLQKREANS